ncbi:hypothetical protein GbCGDNIH1_8051 [Granulibacter bethesdensis CGDNIH1]|uniref:Uncharacterized protein n=1 Tax=Granulibacter bethesdensis (strain ATCC BAA-1260 / CGDNIH1) TaxID=391165 RepID=A0A286M388_GRABC|nr:hypothetical protein GbCGDNIH5_8051 [Granulibacter bethesdensis]APH60516.1 hypothetical protein GbCGDNIH7_8051 [Granulibacter bethesdensis]APH65632.1 hypothetical protein GbCGDNIH1I4_8051 [Granulibacter bethesdensis]ASV62487.1 hypothetical protein GbCGDNIH1_8051 [Granulibacter bethesdensis CGDNIH1]
MYRYFLPTHIPFRHDQRLDDPVLKPPNWGSIASLLPNPIVEV